MDPPLPDAEAQKHNRTVVDETPVVETKKAIGGDDKMVRTKVGFRSLSQK